MAHFPGAEWIGPTPNETDGGQIDVHGLVLHIQEGTEAGSEAWFTNPAAQASSHFLNPKSGGLRQLVDTANRAWAEMAGNRHWLSVENEGYSGDQLTDSQVENVAQLFAWIHTTYGTPLQATDDPNGEGLGWHGMGGDAWGGHFDCPGDPIKAQRPRILARANEILGGGVTPTPQPQPQPSGNPARYQTTINGLSYGYGAHGVQVTEVGLALVEHGFGSHYHQGPGPDWSDADTLNYADYQRSLGYSGSDADGVPGSTSLQKLLGYLPGSVPAFPGANAFGSGNTGDYITMMGRRLVARGYGSHYRVGPGPSWGDADRLNVQAFQEAQGWSGSGADGYPGPETWRRLFS